MKQCAVCTKETNDYFLYWAYAPRLGKEKSLPVCPKCDKHFNHAASIVEAKIQKQYKV